MHIGYVTIESPYGDKSAGGIASYLRAIIPGVVEAGHRVTVLANAKENRSFVAEEGTVNVHHFRLPSKHWYAARLPVVRHVVPLPLRQLEWSAEFYRQAARVAAREKIDVLESTETGSLFLSRIAPTVIRLHGSEFAFRRHSGLPLTLSARLNDSLEARSCNRVAAITAPSLYQGSETAKRRGWPAGRVQVIPNPISSTIWTAARETENNNDPEPIVLCTGRLAPVKGVETFLEAAKSLHAQNPKVTFVLAGPWQMPRSPEMYGLELNRKSTGGVLWVGPQEQHELIFWYRRATLFVVPSNYESFGISAVEAMAFGLPVVATRAGGLPEIVREEVTGVLVPPREPAALSKAISEMLSDAEGRKRMGDAARDHVRANFAPGPIVKATLKVYAGVQRADTVRNELEVKTGAPSLGVGS